MKAKYPVVLLNNDTKEEKVFPSGYAVAKSLGMNSVSINALLRGAKKKCKALEEKHLSVYYQIPEPTEAETETPTAEAEE